MNRHESVLDWLFDQVEAGKTASEIEAAKNARRARGRQAQERGDNSELAVVDNLKLLDIVQNLEITEKHKTLDRLGKDIVVSLDPTATRSQVKKVWVQVKSSKEYLERFLEMYGDTPEEAYEELALERMIALNGRDSRRRVQASFIGQLVLIDEMQQDYNPVVAKMLDRLNMVSRASVQRRIHLDNTDGEMVMADLSPENTKIALALGKPPSVRRVWVQVEKSEKRVRKVLMGMGPSESVAYYNMALRRTIVVNGRASEEDTLDYFMLQLGMIDRQCDETVSGMGPLPDWISDEPFVRDGENWVKHLDLDPSSWEPY